jgi:predicted RNA-binding Zn ribbon-like protein
MSEALAIQFANTVGSRRSSRPQERISDYRALVEWGVGAELFGRTEAARLLAAAEARPSEATAACARAIALRDALYRIFEGLGDGKAPATDDLEVLNGALGECAVRRRLRQTGQGLCWTWAEAPEADLDWMLWPIAYSAAELLTSSSADRVKACPGDGCGWIFLDQSRNRSRRWCDMQSCGNREKARRHYHRARTAPETTPASDS